MKSPIRTMYDMGLVIRQRRTFLGLSQEALARRAGVSRSWLAKVELGNPRNHSDNGTPWYCDGLISRAPGPPMSRKLARR